MAGTVTAYIDVDDVLAELTDRDLIDEVADRGLSMLGIAPKGTFTERDLSEMKDAAEAGRAWDLMAIFQSALGLSSRSQEAVAAAYAALPRDPESGRPVIQ